MLVARHALLVIHIISAGFWIAQFPVEMVLQRWLRNHRGKSGELPVIAAVGSILSMMGQIGGMGILITGLGLVAIEGLGFLSIGGNTPLWLTIKQVNYLIAMGIVGYFIVRPQKEFVGELEAVANGGTSSIPQNELVQRFNRLMVPSRIVNLLVLINIILAVWKPM
jgi:hypothetical protein